MRTNPLIGLDGRAQGCFKGRVGMGGVCGWDLHRWQYSNRWASVLAKPLAHGSRLLPPHLLPWHGCGRVVSAGADVGRVLHGHRVV